MTLPFAASSAPVPPRNSVQAKWLVLILLGLGAAFVAWREQIIQLPKLASTSDSDNGWSGSWFFRYGSSDIYDLPALQIGKSFGGRLGGRIITRATDGKHDIGLTMEELVVADDGLTFVTNGSTRIKYRLVHKAADSADLYVVHDTEYILKNYLGENGVGTTKHSATEREWILHDLAKPKPPELIAMMVRVNVSTPAGSSKPALPALPPADLDASGPATPAKTSTGKTPR